MLDATMRKQTQIKWIRHESSYKQLEVKTEHRFYAEIVTDLTTQNSERRLIMTYFIEITPNLHV
jgi:hypothetical protein